MVIYAYYFIPLTLRAQWIAKLLFNFYFIDGIVEDPQGKIHFNDFLTTSLMAINACPTKD